MPEKWFAMTLSVLNSAVVQTNSCGTEMTYAVLSAYLTGSRYLEDLVLLKVDRSTNHFV